VVVGAGLQALLDDLGARERSEHHDRDLVGPGAQRLERGNAIHHWHVDVEQHEVRRSLVEQLERLPAVSRFGDDLASHRRDDRLDQEPHVRLVVGQQYTDLALLAHRSISPRLSARSR
jgi:hypothetical protein